MKMETNSGIKYVASSRAFCDGGNNSLGHPGVYIKIGLTEVIACPYCGQQFAIINEEKNDQSSGGNN